MGYCRANDRETSVTHIGIVGAGLLGSAIGERLLGAGYAVDVVDVDPAKRALLVGKGAAAADSVAALLERCRTLVLAVFDSDQVDAVVEGPGGIVETSRKLGLEPRVIISTTCEPERLAALSQRMAKAPLRLVEAPISGTSQQVREGASLALMAGERAFVDEVMPVMAAICPRQHFLGEIGNGSRAKLAVNLVLGLNRAALAEGMVFADRLGIDKKQFLEIARASAAYSQAMDNKGPLMAAGIFDKPQSRVALSLKDFGIMLEQAHARGQELPFASLYVEMLEDCVQAGAAELDNAVVTQAIARRRRPAQ